MRFKVFTDEQNEALRKHFLYDPNTGLVYRKFFYIDGTFKVYALTCKNSNGYLMANLSNYKLQVLAHRLAWFLHYGEWPSKQIDHINRDILDNRISNLRDVDNKVNQENNRLCTGYYWHKRDKKYVARIKHNKKLIQLGRFDHKDDARKAYLEGKKKYHKHHYWDNKVEGEGL